jgi:formylglycine-generating enzyme required for sulfatase activity
MVWLTTLRIGQAVRILYSVLINPINRVSWFFWWMKQKSRTAVSVVYTWVCDSITRERLADPAYGGIEDYKITEDAQGEPVKPHLNWRIPIPSRKHATEEELTALNYLYEKDEIDGGYRLKTDLILYRYEWYDYEAAAKREFQIDPAKRIRNTDLSPAQLPRVMITKDTAYITETGQVINTSITRPLSSRYDFLNTYIIPVYPNTTCWVNDFPNIFNDPYLQNYFSHPAYNAYPVVGVSWLQAMAFCHWRTMNLNNSLSLKGQKIMPYRLPTEAEWELAARGKQLITRFPWKSYKTSTERGCYYANFKPSRGGYSEDGYLISSKVASFPPNEYGLYDMAGNVAEWTSTNWSESGYEDMNDLNPSLHQHINRTDFYINKRKVVRGGSWKDAARFMEVSSRTYEYENETRSFIGFRCVRSLIGEPRTR